MDSGVNYKENTMLTEEDFGNQVDLSEYACTRCKETINLLRFKNELAVEEFSISGLCQSCQDENTRPHIYEETITEKLTLEG